MICPLTEMSVREYKNLLASLAAVCEKTMKVPLRGTNEKTKFVSQ